MTDITDLIIVLGIILIIWAAVAVGIRIVRFILGPAPVPREFGQEAPSIPEPILKAMAARERIAQSYDMGAKRKAWARDMDLEREIHDLIGDVRERGDR